MRAREYRRSGSDLLLAPLLLVLLCTVACEDPPSDPRLTVVAYVGDEPIYLSEVQHYLANNLVYDGVDAAAAGEAMDEVKSRLLDALLEERLLYAEAQRRGIQVSDLEVATYLDMGAADTLDDPEDRAWRELEARQRLMVQKLQEQIVLEQPPPTDREVEAYAEENGRNLLPAQPLELRALQVESMTAAKRVHREIRRKRMTFNEAALAHEPSPGQALPQRMSWDGLSDDLREALMDLKPGQVSEPMELHGSIYLFQVGSWLQEPEDQDEERRRRARLELEAQRRRAALEAMLDGLRARSEVRIKSANLPFRYVPV